MISDQSSCEISLLIVGVHGIISIPINHDIVCKRYEWRCVFVVSFHSETFVRFRVCPGNVAHN